MEFPKKLNNKLDERISSKALRSLKKQSNLIDFSSNDYLGFAKSETIFTETHQSLLENNLQINGATGSRLLSGNHDLYEEVERDLCDFHQSEAAIIFNSGYDANIGFFSSVPQRGDIILYDELIHASIRDGIKMSNAKSYKFTHNNLEDLERQISRFARNDKEDLEWRSREVSKESAIYVITESVFSMDGDTPDLKSMATLCKKHNSYFIVDEAHAVGVFGDKGVGLVQDLGLETAVFARIITFGKALGCHGAAILGSAKMKDYLVNFARSFIYTTGLPPHSLATIKTAYQFLNVSSSGVENSQQKLQENIRFFTSEVKRLDLDFIESNSAIHCSIISGNERTRLIAQKLQEKGFDVKAILSPTVPEGEERLRFCLHSYNSEEEMSNVLETLRIFVS